MFSRLKDRLGNHGARHLLNDLFTGIAVFDTVTIDRAGRTIDVAGVLVDGPPLHGRLAYRFDPGQGTLTITAIDTPATWLVNLWAAFGAESPIRIPPPVVPVARQFL